MGLREWIVPREKRFFDMIDKQAAKIKEGTAILIQLLENPQDIEQKRKQLKDVEREADRIVHNIFSELNKTFITPIDSEDISILTTRLDDVLDYIYASANRFFLYNAKPDSHTHALAVIVSKAVDQLIRALFVMRNMNKTGEIEECCIEIHELENQADEILNNAVAGLFSNTGQIETIEVIKLKEIYEYLEIITDRCEDVTDIIRRIVIKHG